MWAFLLLHSTFLRFFLTILQSFIAKVFAGFFLINVLASIESNHWFKQVSVFQDFLRAVRKTPWENDPRGRTEISTNFITTTNRGRGGSPILHPHSWSIPRWLRFRYLEDRVACPSLHSPVCVLFGCGRVVCRCNDFGSFLYNGLGFSPFRRLLTPFQVVFAYTMPW